MIKIEAIPAFQDNYIWCGHSSDTKEAFVVDPGNADVVIEFINQNGLSLKSIFVTHHHADHTGGIKKLRDTFDLNVYGPQNSNYPHIDNKVSDGELIKFPGVQLEVIEVPGHTLDHIAYFIDASDNNSSPILFCGDTLFSAGCGRLFEGTPEQMHHSLVKIAQFPDETRVYAAHEYTMANLEFALHITPSNEDVIAYKEQCQNLRAQGIPTLPTTLKIEKSINPFLRTSDEEVRNSLKNRLQASELTELQAFTELRKIKDSF